MTDTPINSPPSYEYQTSGPWWVVHVDQEGRPQAWTMAIFESAVLRFWLDSDHSNSGRRVLVDSYGTTVMAYQRLGTDMARMSGTRQACDATLKMITDRGHEFSEAEQIALKMIDNVRALDGQAQ